jgi:hypothetical protein
MREPQATSTLGALHQALTAPRRPLAAAVLVVLAFLPGGLQAQIRGAPQLAPSTGWWISGGASALVLTDITDGASQTRWRFGSDPLWQYRASLEKALDDFTTLGVSAGYGRVPLTLSPITPDSNAVLPAVCLTSCAATTELWTAMAQFRSGGGPGFHTLFEASGGGTIFRNFVTRDSAIAIPGIARSLDLSGTLGAGFAYTLSNTMVVAVVQDFGIGFHAKTGLPEGTARTWRVRNTRASLRLKFGGR